jgi:hypothetical protein
MLKNRIIKVSSDGIVTGLYSDFLSDLGQVSVRRASNVEFCEETGKWVVEMLIGPFAHSCLLKTFSKRADALAAEVAVLNGQHEIGLLDGEVYEKA